MLQRIQDTKIILIQEDIPVNTIGQEKAVINRCKMSKWRFDQLIGRGDQ